MSALVPAFATMAGLVAGAYMVGVLERLIMLGPRHARLALTLPLSEAASFLRQEDLTPRGADALLFKTAPLVAFVTVALAALAIPLGPGAAGLDTPVGLFYFIVVLGPFVVAMMNAGWGQNGKAGLFGAFRAAAHLVSYEVPLGFAAIGPVMAAGSLSTTRIVAAQNGLWFAVWQPLGVAIYALSAYFMAYRHPFDLPQAGSELAGGVLAEYSGPRLLLVRIALDSIFLLLMAMGAVLFFGGWQGPLLPPPVWLALKTATLAALLLCAGRRCPRLRPDQMLSLSWKLLLPTSLVHVMLTGLLLLILPGGSA